MNIHLICLQDTNIMTFKKLIRRDLPANMSRYEYTIFHS